jgi:SAM-dependent methyltransferase
MPSIEENINKWSDGYDWSLAGDEWSKTWGGASAQWYGSIYPRIHIFLPTGSVLEIAPGHGRWTQFLLDNCDSLVGVDVTSSCTEACQERFAKFNRASFFTNDGQALPMVSDSSIDFAFSFDSLVHVELGTLASYLEELARCLKADGVAFLHHSNYGTYSRSAELLAPFQSTLHRLPSPAQVGLLRAGVFRGGHWRAPSVTAAAVTELCEPLGLRCVTQELVNWAGGALLLDCFSVITPAGSRWEHPYKLVKNRLFRLEARGIRQWASAYEASPH